MALPEADILSEATMIGPNIIHPDLPPIGHCIYCNKTEYAPGSSRPLGEEHIINEGLGGTLVLPESSCRKCEGDTSGIETKISDHLLFAVRRRMGLRGKKSRSRKSVILTTLETGVDVIIKPSLENHPTILMLPVLKPPAILTGRPVFLTSIIAIWLDELAPIDEIVKRGPKIFTTPALDIVVFCQFLAKIAHSYAMALLQKGQFLPVLPSLIERKLHSTENDPEFFEFVGGVPGQYRPSTSLHELSLFVTESQGKSYVSVAIRLFALRGGPIYSVIVGPLTPGVTKESVRVRPGVPKELRAHTTDRASAGLP